ncbi:MAG: bifunctional glutamate N-acetyltransferase/amino-acid acetyltransferase ArgJ [Aquificae bacterium]|nr:bifunctional glutamate N-acetyltransferase/amino-acid acetyltransferase ArgJ [Aquificota bacterium]
MEVLMGVAKAGLKPSGREDLLVVYLPKACEASFVFTRNHFKAAPVVYSSEVWRRNRRVRALVINSGNANCGTGERGLEDARLMALEAAKTLKLKPEEVLVFSTGVIGRYLPRESVLRAVREACLELKPLDLKKASEVISTTDRFPKFDFTRMGELETYGFAKGAGMIHPSMATMLAFVFTNARLPFSALRELHLEVTEKTFNSITVDGCTSTNDAFGVISLGEVETDAERVRFELFKVSESLAKQIVRDGEGATRVIKVRVLSASSEEKARAVAQAVATSLLVKVAVFGKDPNWGRIAAAAGSTPYPIDPLKMRILIGEHLLYDGRPVDQNLEPARRYMLENSEVVITVELNEGEGSWVYYSSDIGYDYVKLNAEYTT